MTIARFSHLAVRIAATANLVQWGLETAYTRYFHVVGHGSLGKFTVLWMLVSSLLLPLYVGIEAWWMQGREVEQKALWIDGIFAGAWFLVLWLSVLYAFGHYAMF